MNAGAHSGPASERGTVEAPRRAPPEEHFTSRKLNAGFAGAGIVSSHILARKNLSVGAPCAARYAAALTKRAPAFQKALPFQRAPPFQKAFMGKQPWPAFRERKRDPSHKGKGNLGGTADPDSDSS